MDGWFERTCEVIYDLARFYRGTSLRDFEAMDAYSIHEAYDHAARLSTAEADAINKGR